MDGLLSHSAEELFTRHATPEAVRAIRAGGPASALWREIEGSGFLDALVPEEAGGAGLGPAELLPVLLAAGRFAVPLPLGETMLARAACARAGQAPPEGAIAMAEPVGGGAARLAPHRHAEWVLLPQGKAAMLLPMAGSVPDAEASSPLAELRRWPEGGGRVLGRADYIAAGAWVEVATMAGAMERILEETIRHARDRHQFGRPIAAFQAIQQQISVLTEDVFASRMAVQLASVPDSDGIARLNTTRIAAAKIRIGEAAVRVAAIAHAVHGAMGITEELDLHLLTGMLQIGRMRFGGEAHWAAWIGRQFLTGADTETLGFVRAHLGPVAPETIV
jgi:acyl-CoA dehydrogenase